MRNRTDIEPGRVGAEKPPNARPAAARRNVLLLFLVALFAISPALAGCYHDDTADEPTPTETDGGGNGDGY